MSFLKKTIKDSINAKRSLYLIESKINLAILHIYKKLRKKGKIFLCGNGGSASDAQHLATEFLIRLKPHINRPPIAALSLANDVSTLTACGNDFSFEKIFSRNLDALASSKDILLVISTSGNSKNIIEVLKMAKKKKIFSIGFFGKSGGKAKQLCNLPLCIKSNVTARIQETHILLGHYIFECVENKILNFQNN